MKEFPHAKGCSFKPRKNLLPGIVLFAFIVIMALSLAFNGDDKPEVEVIDGCDYIKTYVRFYPVYTHKGNCRNPIHNK